MILSLKISANVFILFAQLFQCKLIRQNNSQLIFAQTLCRHGQRNIYKQYHNDPWKAEEHWPAGYAQLTKIGKQQQFSLGQFFQQRYVNLLGNGAYSPNKVYVQSSDIDRVIMSAQVCLAALFPPSLGDDEQLWNKNLEWQPIPVHTQSRIDDYLLAGEKRCDRYDYLMLKYMNGSEYKGWFQQNRELIAFLEDNSGMKLPTVTTIFDLYDTLSVEKLNGKRLPTFAEKLMLPGSDFEKLALKWFSLFTSGSNELKMYKSGYLLKEIFDRFVSKSHLKLEPDRSLWMYFAHDITLANVLNSLGLFEPHFPPFASCIFFELYKVDETSSPYVQIVYRNSTETDGIPLEIPNCGPKCPLQKLYALYENILPTQTFDRACALRAGESLPADGNPENSSL